MNGQAYVRACVRPHSLLPSRDISTTATLFTNLHLLPYNSSKSMGNHLSYQTLASYHIYATMAINLILHLHLIAIITISLSNEASTNRDDNKSASSKGRKGHIIRVITCRRNTKNIHTKAFLILRTNIVATIWLCWSLLWL